MMAHLPLPTPSSPRRVLRLLAACALVATCALPSLAQGPAAIADPAASGGWEAGRPQPVSAWSEAVHALRDSIVATARAQVGRRYVHGGQSPASGFDCSGLMRYVLGQMDLALPRTAAQQALAGVEVVADTAHLKPGDLLTFAEGKRGPVSHIGIYVGDGRYVHASSVAGRVIESPLDRPASPLIKKWRGVRRVVADSISIPLGAS